MSAAHQPRTHSAAQEDSCRLDIWLWRARFFKTRALAARFLDEGRLRIGRHGSDPVRVDKPSRSVRCGDALVFAMGGRLIAVQVEGLGDRRGPASEARDLYRETPPTHS